MPVDVTKRFSNRVHDYILYRPGYPTAIIGFLKKECGLTSSSIIADIGSGTGKSAQMFLENGNTVYAIEPNDEMRHAAETILNDFSGFVSINAKAEKTSLPDNYFDFIVAGQAFHWFNYKDTKKEFGRILKKGGFVVLIWNERPVNEQGFMGDYDRFLMDFSIDYAEIDHRNIDEKVLSEFYKPGIYSLKEFENKQVFDFEGLKGRYDSCSYAIPSDNSRYEETLKALHRLFDTYQKDGHVIMEYVAKVYWGRF